MARGSAIKKGNTWYAYYREPAEKDENGKKRKPKQIWKRIGRCDVPKTNPDYATKKMVEAYLDEVSTSIRNNTYVNLPDITFSEFADDFIKGHETRVKKSTITKYKTHLSYKINPYFKGRTLKSIRALDVEKFLANLLEEGMSPNNSAKYLATLKTVLKRAVELGYLVKSPAAFVKPPRKTKTDMMILTPAEVAELIKNTDKRYKTLMMLASYTGMRKAEALYLKWDDIDFNSYNIYVRSNDLRDLKSEAAKRTVPIIPALAEALKAHQLQQMVDLKANPHNLVFTNSKGNALNPANLDNRVLKPALKLAELRSIRWHDLRHSYASALLAAGEPIAYVSKLLGHADVAITLRVYTHVLPTTEADAHSRHQAIFTPVIVPEKIAV